MEWSTFVFSQKVFIFQQLFQYECATEKTQNRNKHSLLFGKTDSKQPTQKTKMKLSIHLRLPSSDYTMLILEDTIISTLTQLNCTLYAKLQIIKKISEYYTTLTLSYPAK